MFPSSKLTESQSQFFSARMARKHSADASTPRVHWYTKAGIVTWDHLTRLYQHKCIHMGRHCEHHLSITLLLLRSREGRRLINSSPGQSNVLWAKERHISDWGRLPNTVTLESRALKKWKVFRETLEACTALPVWLQCTWLLKSCEIRLVSQPKEGWAKNRVVMGLVHSCS